MANKIQIKRSVANATVTGLSNGELAFTQAGNTLHIGLPDGSGVLRIGGAQYPGTLTNSHALVANSTGAIDKVITANLVADKLYANGGFGSSGQLLASAGNGANMYWVDAGTLTTQPAGTNTQVQFNDSNTLGASAGFTFDKASNTLLADKLTVVNTTSSSNTTTGAATVAGGLGVAGRINTAEIAIGNDSVYSSANGTHFLTGNVFATGTVNGSTLSVGGWVIANNSGIFTSGVVNGDIIRVGSAFIANTTKTTVGTSLDVNTSISVGNSSVNTQITAGNVFLNGSTLVVGNTATNVTINSVAIAIGATIINSTSFTGTAYNANNASYLGGVAAADYQTESGLAANVATLTANNADNLGGVAAANYVQNTDSRTLSGNLTFTGTDFKVTGTNANVSSNVSLTGSLTTISSNVNISGAAINATSATLRVLDAEIAGNLTINGTLTTINTTSLSVKDALIKVADNNTSSDTVDFGVYGVSGNASTTWYSGFYRDHSASGLTAPVFKLFASNTEPTSIVDNTAVGYALGTLYAYLTSGGLVSNSSTVAITANGSVNVAIVANTLTLATALAGNSGGTGLSSITNNALLVGNSTNGFTQLSLGTEGYVLQSNGTALVYDTLDGGTF